VKKPFVFLRISLFSQDQEAGSSCENESNHARNGHIAFLKHLFDMSAIPGSTSQHTAALGHPNDDACVRFWHICRRESSMAVHPFLCKLPYKGLCTLFAWKVSRLVIQLSQTHTDRTRTGARPLPLPRQENHKTKRLSH
jgi:hypothetical protein